MDNIRGMNKMAHDPTEAMFNLVDPPPKPGPDVAPVGMGSAPSGGFAPSANMFRDGMGGGMGGGQRLGDLLKGTEGGPELMATIQRMLAQGAGRG